MRQNRDLSDYRYLYAQEQINSQRTLDKTLLSLSSGSFAISFAFIDKFITAAPIYTEFVITGWLLLTTCILIQISSHFLSYHAFKEAIRTSDGVKFDYEHVANPGGKYSLRVDSLNIWSAIIFGLGLISIIIFIYINY